MKTKQFLKNNSIYLLGFGIPLLAMLIIFMIRTIFPFGDRSFLHIDMYHQYFPFLTEFYHKLKAGDSLLYSWNTGIGSNFLALFVYYLASPTNWLSILVPEQYLMEFLSYFVIIKIGLCGFTFSYYLSKHFNSKHISILFFSTAYALSGYMAAYNWNVMWLDVILLAPLVLLGLELLVKEGKCTLYCLTLGFSILTNYYLSIMLCIFLICYFFVLLVTCENKGKAFLNFTIYSLIAGGMAAVLLLPEMEMLLQTEFSNSTFPKEVTSYFSIFDTFSRHLANVTVETGLDHWPNIYCGVFILFLGPIYFLSKSIPLKEKIARAALLLFLLVSFSTNTLTFIWHGFNYPDSLPCRQSFLYIFVILVLCFEGLQHIREFSIQELGKIFTGTFLFLLLVQKLVTDDAFTPATYLMTGICLVVYAILLILYNKDKKHHKMLVYVTLIAVIIELMSNTLLTSVSTVSRTNYLANIPSYEALNERIHEKDPDFYRIERQKHITNNDAMLSGYQSASLFSSTTNSLVNQFYQKYGMKSSRVFYAYDGVTPLTSALLAVKYMYTDNELPSDSLYQLVDQEGNLYFYQNTYALPVGFFVTDHNSTLEVEGSIDIEEILDTSTNSNPIITQNILAQNLGADATLFDDIHVSESSNSATIEVMESSHIYAYAGNRKVAEITAYDENGKKEFKKLKNPYILDLGYQEAGSVITLEASTQDSLNLSAYQFNEQEFDSLIRKLKENPFTLTSYDSTHVNGKIVANNSGTFVVSIPYEPGWTLYVDGVKTSPQLFEDCFMAVPLDAGTHEISLVFQSKSLIVGTIISIISIMTFIAIIFFSKRAKKTKDEVTSPKALHSKH